MPRHAELSAEESTALIAVLMSWKEDFVREHHRERGWMQHVGERLGYTKGAQQQVSSILDRQTVGIAKARLIYKALGVDREDFLRARGIRVYAWPEERSPEPAPARTAPVASSVDPPIKTFLMRLRRLPGLEAWLEEPEVDFSVSQVAKVIAIYQHAPPSSQSDGQPVGGWAGYFSDALSGKLTKARPSGLDEAVDAELSQMSPSARERLRSASKK